MGKSKFKFSDLKDIFSPTVILCLLCLPVYRIVTTCTMLTDKWVTIQALGLSATNASFITSALQIVGIFLTMPAGMLLDTTEKKKNVLLLSWVFCVAGVLAYRFAPTSIRWYLLAQICLKITSASMTVILMAVIGGLVNPSIRGTAMAIAGVAGTIGDAYVRPVIVSVYAKSGFAATNNMAIGSIVILGILIMLLKNKNMVFKGGRKGQKASMNPLKAFKGISAPILWITFISCFMAIPNSLNGSWLTVAADARNVDIVQGFAVSGTIAVVMAVFAGIICDIIDGRIAFGISFIFGAIGLTMEGYAATSSMMTIAMAFAALSGRAAVFGRAITSKWADVSNIGRISAAMNCMLALVQFFGEPMIGLTVDNFGYPAAYSLGGVVCIACLAILIGVVLVQNKKEKSASMDENVNTANT